MSVAQSFHSLEHSLKLRFLDYKSEPVRRLSDAKAVEVGADFLSETFIFSVAGLLIGMSSTQSNPLSSGRRMEIPCQRTEPQVGCGRCARTAQRRTRLFETISLGNTTLSTSNSNTQQAGQHACISKSFSKSFSKMCESAGTKEHWVPENRAISNSLWSEIKVGTG